MWYGLTAGNMKNTWGDGFHLTDCLVWVHSMIWALVIEAKCQEGGLWSFQNLVVIAGTLFYGAHLETETYLTRMIWQEGNSYSVLESDLL